MSNDIDITKEIVFSNRYCKKCGYEMLYYLKTKEYFCSKCIRTEKENSCIMCGNTEQLYECEECLDSFCHACINNTHKNSPKTNKK
jgi:hypothetical protein